MTSLTGLKKQGMANLILDLRGNTGGVLDEAVEIADEFLSGDKLITYTEGKHQPKKEYRCKREGQFENGELILLCDEESASASEILLGALQDWDRAKIFGTRSFGKGLVQEQYELSDNSALRLTVARYFTPIGRCIQRSYANGKAAYYMNEPSDSSVKKKVFLSSKGKKLYDGGGIEPDIKIEQDSLFSKTYEALYDKGIQLSELAYITYLSQKKSGTKISKIRLENDWIQTLPDSISSQISALKPELIQVISHNVEANIVRMEDGVSKYQQTLNRYDPVIKAAVLSLTESSTSK
jgi:carboxyl-terminal processing protease